MTTFLNIALLLVSTTATLAAFGGKTWKEGTQPILERITRRGWVSLGCLIIALSLGTYKEIRTQLRDSQKQIDDAIRATESKNVQTDLVNRLEDSKQAEARAQKNLDDLRKSADAAENHLKATQESLDDVRGNLKQARDDLSQQSAASFTTALANVDRHIQTVELFLPLTAKARNAGNIREAFLPFSYKDGCSESTLVGLTIFLSREKQEGLLYWPFDTESSHKHFSDPIQKTDALTTRSEYNEIGQGKVINTLTAVIGQMSTNGEIYTASFHPTADPISAADFYGLLMRPGAQIISISISGLPIHPVTPYRQDCSNQVRKYFRSAFEKALLLVNMDGPVNETLMFRLKAVVGVDNDGMWSVGFVPDSPPTVVPLGDEVLGTLHDWPAPKGSAKPK